VGKEGGVERGVERGRQCIKKESENQLVAASGGSSGRREREGEGGQSGRAWKKEGGEGQLEACRNKMQTKTNQERPSCWLQLRRALPSLLSKFRQRNLGSVRQQAAAGGTHLVVHMWSVQSNTESRTVT
jgi:hypothetical protein